MSSPAVFLDRDGTLIQHYDYLTDPGQVKLLPNAAKALGQLRQRGYALVVITNQSAVARGMITEKKLLQIHERMKSLLAEQGAYVDRIYYCPFHPEGEIEKYRKESELRKPSPGMLLMAAEEMDLDLSQSWMVGDDSRDIGAGLAAGCRTILLDSHSASQLVRRGEFTPDFRAVNMQEAANLIFRQQNKPKAKADAEPEKLQQDTEAVEPKQDADNNAVQKPPENPQPKPMPKESEPAPAEIIDQPNSEIQQPKQPDLAKNDQPISHTEKPANSEKSRPRKKKTSIQQKRTVELLSEILRELKVNHRQQGFAEFSAAKLVAGLTQMLVILFLVLAFSSYISLESNPAATQNSLLAAIVFQLMTLTLLSMQRH